MVSTKNVLHFRVLRRCYVLAGALSKPFDFNVSSKPLDLNTCMPHLYSILRTQFKISGIYLNQEVMTKHLNQKVLTEHLLRQSTS